MKKLLEGKQRKKRVEEEDRLKKLKKQKEIWEYINKWRGIKERKKNNVEKEVWRNHLMELLEGIEMNQAVKDKVGENEKKNEDQIEEEEIEEEEIRRGIKKIKKKKAAGIGDIPMEAWMFSREGIWRRLVLLLKKIWKEGIIGRIGKQALQCLYIKKVIQKR